MEDLERLTIEKDANPELGPVETISQSTWTAATLISMLELQPQGTGRCRVPSSFFRRLQFRFDSMHSEGCGSFQSSGVRASLVFCLMASAIPYPE